jgi:hypothetical protein
VVDRIIVFEKNIAKRLADGHTFVLFIFMSAGNGIVFL